MSPAVTWLFLLVLVGGAAFWVGCLAYGARLDGEIADLLENDRQRAAARDALARTGGVR